MKALAAALGLALPVLSAVEGLAAQDQQPPRATFKSNVDLVPVDVNVIDKSGRPVRDLAAGDFTLTVDGKPRRIASAQFISVDRAVDSAPPSTPMEYNSNTGAQGGRLVMIAVDSNNIGVGRGKAAIDAARRFVGTLNRADRVALVTLPGAGPQIEFTSNHAVVQAMLDNVVGQATDNFGQKRVGLAEALAIQRQDKNVSDEVIGRECESNSTPDMMASCLRQLTAESNYMLAQVRQRTNNALISLRYLFERMTSSDTPKTIVLISEGLLLEREFTDVAWVEPRAAAAHITLYVLQLDLPEMEAMSHRTSPSRGEDHQLLREGLDRLAGMAKGDVFKVAGNADFVFQRLAVELSGYYLLSFEPLPGDRDGKTHQIRIDVGRKNLTLRSRREFSVSAAGSRSTEEVVLETLRAPLLATDMGLKLTTYTFQDPDSAKLKIILAADIDRSLSPGGNVSLAYLLLDDKGKLVASDVEKALSNPIDPGTKTQKYLGAALVPPGVYTLKVAVADEDGRRGSVERAFQARINGFGQIHATDLLIADNRVAGAKGLPPAVAADFVGDELHAYVELYSEAPEQLRNATVMMEVARDETSRALDSTPARFQPLQTGADKRRVAEAGVPIALLPAGDYVARAVISVSGRKVGQVVRPFRVTRAVGAVSAPGGGTVPMRAAEPIVFTSKIDAFDKSSVLTPQVVGFFLDRMSAAAAANAASVRPAIDSVRAGRFDQAMESLKNAGDDQLASVFLKGLVLLSGSDLEGAAGKFRAALRLDPEFLPAAFYLGACYAAGGKDRDAAGAWQTSLITESNAPFVYTLLGDALLRLKDMDQAIDILVEARTLWPADDQVAMRLGTALVLANKPADAMRVLVPYLGTHPSDHERLFLVLRALYEARSAGRPIATLEADRALFVRYADAYTAANGPQQALVAQWRKYVEK
jgi:VWFA-related protein